MTNEEPTRNSAGKKSQPPKLRQSRPAPPPMQPPSHARRMTEGQWVAAQESSIPSMSTIWVTMLVSFMPAAALIFIHWLEPQEPNVLMVGFTICSGAIVVGGLVLVHALAPTLEGDTVEERIARRRMRRHFEQASNAMVATGVLLVGVSLVGVWLSSNGGDRAHSLGLTDAKREASNSPKAELPIPAAMPPATKQELQEPVKKADPPAVEKEDLPQDKLPQPEEKPDLGKWYEVFLDDVIEGRIGKVRFDRVKAQNEEAYPPLERELLVGIVIKGRMSPAEYRSASEKLGRLARRFLTDTGRQNWDMQSPRRGGQGRKERNGIYLLWFHPIANIQAIADGIDFGTVESVDAQKRFIIVQYRR